jgi:hypothetical protein
MEAARALRRAEEKAKRDAKKAKQKEKAQKERAIALEKQKAVTKKRQREYRTWWAKQNRKRKKREAKLARSKKFREACQRLYEARLEAAEDKANQDPKEKSAGLADGWAAAKRPPVYMENFMRGYELGMEQMNATEDTAHGN